MFFEIPTNQNKLINISRRSYKYDLSVTYKDDNISTMYPEINYAAARFQREIFNVV